MAFHVVSCARVLSLNFGFKIWVWDFNVRMSREVVYYLHDAGAQIEIKMARVKMTNECKSWSMVHVGTINVSSTTCVDNLDVIFSG